MSRNANFTARLSAYATRTVRRPGSPIGPGGLPPTMFLDLFCSGHALLPDGRHLIGGGTGMMPDSTPEEQTPWSWLVTAALHRTTGRHVCRSARPDGPMGGPPALASLCQGG